MFGPLLEFRGSDVSSLRFIILHCITLHDITLHYAPQMMMMMMMMMMLMMMMIMRRRRRRRTDTKTRHALYASRRCRNAHGHVRRL